MTGFPPDHVAADVRVSPNFGMRRDGLMPDAIVLHYTGMESGAAAEAWLCNLESEVSAHYLVHEDGAIVQMVRETDRAWHAGRSSWGGASDVNSLSIGIEIANPGHDFGYRDFPDGQIDAVIGLCRDVCRRHAILPERVLAHSDVAPGRKIDPGERFPWARLAGEGVGHFVAPVDGETGVCLDVGEGGPEVEELQAMLAFYGYGIEIAGVYDEQTRTVVRAFQRHFRPARVDGKADSATVETLRKLLSALPPSRR